LRNDLQILRCNKQKNGKFFIDYNTVIAFFKKGETIIKNVSIKCKGTKKLKNN